MTVTPRRPLVAVAWLALLAGTLAILHGCAGALPMPPVPWPLDQLDGWIQARGPVGAAFSVLRALALAVTWYLVAVSALTLLARIARSPSLAHVALQLTPRAARAAVRSLLGAALTVTLLGTAAPVLAHAAAPVAASTVPPSTRPGSVIAGLVVRTDVGTLGSAPDQAAPPGTRPPATIVVTPLDPSTPTTTGPAPTPPPSRDPGAPPTPTTTVSPTTIPGTVDPDGPADPTPAGGAAPGSSPAPPVTPTPPAPPTSSAEETNEGASGALVGGAVAAPTAIAEALGRDVDAGPAVVPTPDPRSSSSVPTVATTWTIAPGDHLWHVAEATLRRAFDRPPTDDEIEPYWHAVIEANRDRLVDPANPDLVVPGQELVLPPAARAPCG